jgi:hypothetical protein
VLVPAAVAEVLDIAESWLGRDQRPVYRDGNARTRRKAVRRVADHLLDHLAELECLLAGLSPAVSRTCSTNSVNPSQRGERRRSRC